MVLPDELVGSATVPDVFHFPAGGYGEVYCPWCAATVLAPGGNAETAAQGHADEQGHNGRPPRLNSALHYASLSRAHAAG